MRWPPISSVIGQWRPGECETAPAASLTYAAIASRHVGGEFLIELENIIHYYVNLNGVTIQHLVGARRSQRCSDSGSVAEASLLGDRLTSARSH
jgi:hypothetical protein